MVKTREQQRRESSNKGGAKVKNKVGSPAPSRSEAFKHSCIGQSDYDTDDFDYDREVDSDVVFSDAVDDSDTSFSSPKSKQKREELPKNLQRQLLEDINKKGGIDKFDVLSTQAICELCDQRPTLYGNRGDKIRKRISKKVARWRKKFNQSPADWYAFVSKLSVTEKRRKVNLKQVQSPDYSDRKPSPVAKEAPVIAFAEEAPVTVVAKEAPVVRQSPVPLKPVPHSVSSATFLSPAAKKIPGTMSTDLQEALAALGVTADSGLGK
jgi:hypothetical protein